MEVTPLCPLCGGAIVTMIRVTDQGKTLKRRCCPNCKGTSFIIKVVVEPVQEELWLGEGESYEKNDEQTPRCAEK